MAQSPMGTRLDSARRGRVQTEIFLFWTYHFEYTHLLPSVVLTYLTVCAKSPSLMSILAQHVAVDFTFVHHSPVSKCFLDIGLQLPGGDDAKSELVLEI